MTRCRSDADWRDIPGYDGAYQISREGQVRTWRYRGEHCLKEPKLLTPYLRKPRANGKRSARRYVKLTDARGNAKEVALMRLMVEVWLGGYPPGMVAYLKNGKTDDLSADNIGFTTPGRLRQIARGKDGCRPVAKLNERGEVVALYPSARKAAKANHLSYQAVIDRCHGKVKKPFALDGYTYRFER